MGDGTEILHLVNTLHKISSSVSARRKEVWLFISVLDANSD